MNTFFALLYSIILFCILSIFTFFIFKQIRKTQNTEARLFQLQKKIQLNSVSSEDYYRLGHVYLSKKLYNKGIIALRQALRYWNYEDKIGLSSLYNTLGVVYFKLSKYEYALYYFSLSINNLPDYTLAMYNIAYSFEKLKMYSEAEIAYKIAFSYDKNNTLSTMRKRKFT